MTYGAGDVDDSDAELLRAAALGDERATRALVTRHVRAAMLLAVQLLGDADEAEDTVQDAFLVVLRRAGDFDATAAFPAWLFGIVRRIARKVRARARRRWRLLERWRAHASPIVQPAAPANVELAELRSAMKALAPMQRACCELAFVHGLAAEEIA